MNHRDPNKLSIEELEAILRADALGPERVDSEVDEILEVIDVLAGSTKSAYAAL